MEDRWLGLVVIAATVFAAAAVGGSLSGDGTAAWYARRRDGLPPLRVVGPTWTLLFACLAAASWRVWLEYGTWEFGYLAPYAGLTALSAYWPVSLFGKRHPGRASVVGLVVAVAAGGLAARYAADTPVAAALTAVFAAGAAVSTVVNAMLWWNDRSLDGDGLDRGR